MRLDVVERVRTVGMTSQFGALPGGQLPRHLAAQRVDAIMQSLQLLLRFGIVPRGALQLLNLLLDFFQLGLCF